MRNGYELPAAALGVLTVLLVSGCSADGQSSASADRASSSVAPDGSSPDQTGAGEDSGGSSKAGSSATRTKPTAQAAADDDGHGAPGAPKKDGRQTDVFDRVPGEETTECVDVGSDRDIRAGDFVGGAFDDAREQFGTAEAGRPKGKVRLYWIPLHTKPMPGVTVKSTQLGSGVTTTLHQKRVADTDQWKFYDTLLKVDAPGRWRFEVSSGGDRGCFEVDFS